jgi:hypothetical protein
LCFSSEAIYFLPKKKSSTNNVSGKKNLLPLSEKMSQSLFEISLFLLNVCCFVVLIAVVVLFVPHYW